MAYLQRPSGYSRAQVTRLGSISVGHLYNLRFRLLLGHAPVDVAFVQALLAQVLRGLVR